MRETLPNTLQVRRRLREQAGPALIPGIGERGGAAGSAFDILVASTLSPEAIAPFQGPRIWTTLHYEVAEAVCATIADARRDDDFFRAVWAYGLLLSSIRSLHSFAASPINPPIFHSHTVDEVLRQLPDLVPEYRLDDLRALDALASEALYPKLSPRAHFHAMLSTDAVLAEADIISEGLLVDLKTSRGTTDATGRLRLLPPAKDVYQVVAYALLNGTGWEETYGEVTEVGIYAARYGVLVTWPLRALANELYGGHADIDDLRIGLHEAMLSDQLDML
ncbi:hypothetical protein [Microbacterium hominis]|uniref:PD-(D/E)XK endonuclease-like domain-containing protein n=1 Tax=Microbacterium hominis TaxID=162426 RepID=A0A7D4PLL6_9MICO|nr:hypothetical protein [Microbacterium hominis]QKJ18955.1 hypothetical protein HQM25_05880 [Microbacterium hominis]